MVRGRDRRTHLRLVARQIFLRDDTAAALHPRDERVAYLAAIEGISALLGDELERACERWLTEPCARLQRLAVRVKHRLGVEPLQVRTAAAQRREEHAIDDEAFLSQPYRGLQHF